MVLTATLNTRFRILNANSLRTKPDFRTRERRAIIDISIPSTETYVTTGNPLDLSVIRSFIEVYAGKVVIQPLLTTANLGFHIIPASDNAAATAQLGVVLLSTGAELASAASIVTSTTTITAEIIGI